MNNNDVQTGLRVVSQIPLDEKTHFLSEEDLKNLGINNNLAFTYYEGMQVYCVAEKTRYIWEESHTGLLPVSFTYPNNLIVNGVDYSNKVYNFVPISTAPDGSETKINAGTNVTVSGNGTIVSPYIINSTVTGTPQGIQDTIDTNNLINQAEIEIALNGGLYVYAIPPSTEIYGTLFAQYGSQGLNVVTAFIGTESSLGKSSLTFYTNKTQFIDSRFNKGIENAGDYEANFTARSLITKQYLESETNKQKVIPAGSYHLTNADNNYTIFIDNGATAMTISLGAITIPNFCVGFIQKGTADVTFSGVTNPIGLKSKGQGYQTFIERELSTSSFYLLGNTKA